MKNAPACTRKKEPVSGIRRAYIFRLVCRCVIFAACVALYFLRPEVFGVLVGFRFFTEFSPLHVLWLLWVIDMIQQLIPVKEHIPLGSQKLFRQRFRPLREKINHQALREYVVSTTKAAYKVFILWAALIALLGALYHFGILSGVHLFLMSAAFYVCDLICVLIWCPFRLILKNRCCTTCRIFNWDHLMMFTPMLFVGSFFSFSLLLLAVAVWVVWEVFVMMYPERFWEQTNEALRCDQCTDKLCTQYCQKLRKGSKEVFSAKSRGISANSRKSVDKP